MRAIEGSVTPLQSPLSVTLTGESCPPAASTCVTEQSCTASAAVPDPVICLPSGAKVTAKLIKSAKSGEFCNLSDFAPVLEPSSVTETTIVDGELVFRPKRTAKSIDSFLLWSMAWAAYEGILVADAPSRYANLAAYRCFIQVCAAKYWWTAVYAYDVRNRACKSMNKSFDFQVIDMDIYVTALDPTTARSSVKQCSRCRSIWHNVKDCPFPPECEVATSTRQASQASSSSGQQRSRNGQRGMSGQICFNWNAGRCTFNPCQRLHVCEKCGGPDPLPRCPRCNPPGSTLNPAAKSYNPAQAGRMG